MINLVALLFLLLLPSCTFNTTNTTEEETPMMGDGRILDIQDNKPNLAGNSLVTTGVLRRATGLEPVIGGVSVFTQEFQLFQVGGKTADAETLSIILDAFPLNSAGAIGATGDVTMIQAFVEFGDGGANFGNAEGSTAMGQVPVTNELVVDVGLGSRLVLPASALKIKMRYTAMKRTPFAANDIVGPDYRLSAGFAYGNSNTVQASKTDTFVTLAPATTFIFNRAKFGYACQLSWSGYPVVGPVGLQFLGQSALVMWDLVIAAGTTPPPVFNWPEGATFLLVSNTSGAQLNLVTLKQFLRL